MNPTAKIIVAKVIVRRWRLPSHNLADMVIARHWHLPSNNLVDRAIKRTSGLSKSA